jgi:outer membrane protein OmpA-like peptidoglycan-associated protein
MRGCCVAVFLGCASAAAHCAEAHVSFLACPTLRDTTPNCWSAQHEGETYFIGAQRGPSDSYLPQMKHQVLVEGVVTSEPRVCGGIVLRPLRVSVLPELNLGCDTPVMPAEGVTPPVLPARSSDATSTKPSDVLGPIGSFMRTPVPQPPFTDRQFRIEFDFGTDVLTDQMQRRVIEILTYAATAKARLYVIRGYSAVSLLTNGQRLAEPAQLGAQRARKVADIFANLGAPRDKLRVESEPRPEEPDGRADAARRRVTVSIIL